MTQQKSTAPDLTSYFGGGENATPPDVTKSWIMQQTMFRIKDPKRSIDFYTKILGMSLIHAGEMPQFGFSVYFVGYPLPNDPIPADPKERFGYCMRVPGCIELTWNHGTEKEDGSRVYNTGNADVLGSGGSDGNTPVRGGWGHIGVTVPDVYEACERFKALGVEFHKSPNSGGMKGLAFIKDPDGYLIEIIRNPLTATGEPTRDIDCMGVPLKGGGGYVDNSKRAAAKL